MLDRKLLGGILLIVGTSLGGGMLALPVATSGVGFLYSSALIILCWLAMTLAALLILEVNLWLPKGSNIVSMADKTLGPMGKALTWLSYLLLLYTLLSAYISGGGDVIHFLLQQTGLALPQAASTTLYVCLFSAIVYTGIQLVESLNSLLMFIKLAIYLLLVISIAPHISPHQLLGGNLHFLGGSMMVLVTSFGFAIIVPSLRDYFDSDIKALRKVILIGSLFPLCCYLAWNAVIMGMIPRLGPHGLMALMDNGNASSGLGSALSGALYNPMLIQFFRLFSTVCLFTAFLGVSLCLFDFLADGLKLKKRGPAGWLLNLLVFAPPLIIVLFHPGIYIKAFNYAGIACVILLLLLPALMAYRGRYHLHLNKHTLAIKPYQVSGGKASIAFIISLSLVLLCCAIAQLL